MSDKFKAVKVSEHVYWVGAIDWNGRDFHGYETPRGSTYNAYLVMADKITLIDTVKAPFKDEMLGRISSIVDPSKIDYIISNHSEMDHTGCLPQVIDMIKPEKVFASKIGVQTLSSQFHTDHKLTAVADGETLNLGNVNLTFMETKMVHWPDSMVTYLAEDRLLFSQDAFGMHLATSERFVDEIDWWIIEHEEETYYANILMPLSPVIQKALAKIADSGIKIDIIAPDHGPIWRKDLDKIIALYEKWINQKPTKRAVIVYDTMWGSTDKMAKSIADGLIDGGIETKVLCIKANHRADVATEVLRSGALIVGSPTINSNMFPTVADVLYYLKGLNPQNLIGGVFGSYGWSGQAPRHIKDMLTEMGVDIVADELRVKYVPDNEALAGCFEFGKKIADELKKRVDEV